MKRRKPAVVRPSWRMLAQHLWRCPACNTTIVATAQMLAQLARTHQCGRYGRRRTMPGRAG